MPAAALRHPETDEELVVPAVSSPDSPPTDESQPDAATPHDLEWRNVASYVDRFTGAEPEIERASRRRVRRHNRFVMSVPLLAGTLVFVELMGLVWVYALDMKMLRHEDGLKRQIQQTSLQIALNQNKLASYKSSPLLTQWATQLGYRPIAPSDFDDVTSNAPVPVLPKEATP